MTAAEAQTVGVDDGLASQLGRFLAHELGSAPRISELRRVGIGRSRQNWLFELDGATPEPLILRRDPEGGLVDTDRQQEFELLKALSATDLPTPDARWLDATGEWLGKPSLIMSRLDGACDYLVLNGTRPLTDRVELATAICDLLAAVHLVDWRALGLDRLFVDPGPAAATYELNQWVEILAANQVEPQPELAFAVDWLTRNAPTTERTALVHADFKPGNILLAGNRITGLLDWELAHLGDPLEDLGWVTQPLRRQEHLIDGAWTATDLLASYSRTTGIDIDEAAIEWWRTFSTFKTAVMQISGLRAFLEGRSDQPYRPTRKVLRTLLTSIEGG